MPLKIGKPDISDPIGKISGKFSIEELTNCQKVLLEIKEQNIVYGGGINQIFVVIQDAIKLRVDGVIYMFHIKDSIAEENQGNGEGISIYRRTGDTLSVLYNEDNIPTINEAIDVLNMKSITGVVTGIINGKFLGISGLYCHDGNKEGEDYPDLIDEIKITQLKDDEIEDLEDAGIKVTILNPLI
ncbi:MAG: hypothetical protein WC850_05915 [Candidatus Gracilibacteria bacterium]